MSRLSKLDYPAYYETYISKVDCKLSVVKNLLATKSQALLLLESIPASKEDFAYKPGKWTTKEVLQHCIDTERIFNMRALCFARKDQTNMPGFDEKKYADQANCDHINFKNMINEFETLRGSSIYLYKSFNEEAMRQIGSANENKISVKAIGYILSGHIVHHMGIIKDRYLS